MSLVIKDDNTIELTRGDTAKIQIGIMQGEEAYEMQTGDVVRFAVKRREFIGTTYRELKDEEPLILIEIPNDTLVLTILPEHTKDLKFGTYLYDVELTMADGTVDTFIADQRFELTTEVH